MSLADDITRLCRDARAHGLKTIDVHSLERLVAQHNSDRPADVAAQQLRRMWVYPLVHDPNDDLWPR